MWRKMIIARRTSKYFLTAKCFVKGYRLKERAASPEEEAARIDK